MGLTKKSMGLTYNGDVTKGSTETKMSLYNFHPGWRGSET